MNLFPEDFSFMDDIIWELLENALILMSFLPDWLLNLFFDAL